MLPIPLPAPAIALQCRGVGVILDEHRDLQRPLKLCFERKVVPVREIGDVTTMPSAMLMTPGAPTPIAARA